MSVKLILQMPRMIIFHGTSVDAIINITLNIDKMTKGRLKDCTEQKCVELRNWKIALMVISRLRLDTNHRRFNFTSTAALTFAATKFFSLQQDLNNMLHRSNRISMSNFSFNFNGFSNRDCLHLFHFEKQDVTRVMDVIAWPATQKSTKRNRYAVSSILVCCVILRRLATPSRWTDLEGIFGKHSSQLSEIFWERLEWLLTTRSSLLTVGLSNHFIQQRTALYSECIRYKLNGLNNCVGFIDVTVIGIDRPSSSHMMQRVAYNGHKRKHS